MNTEKVIIFGAGIAGLVAAINLSRSGFIVEVREKRDKVGGPQAWHPSVHLQYFNPEKTSEYIGINLSPCFYQVKTHSFNFYKHTRIINSPINCYVCSKGGGEGTIEKYLYEIAHRQGVTFIFDRSFNLQELQSLNEEKMNCILATGLEKSSFEVLKIPYVAIQGYKSSMNATKENVGSSYYGDYTNNEYAYYASFGNFLFCLIFTRIGMVNDDLIKFQDYLWKKDKLKFNQWHFSSGCVPLEKNLVKNGVVLAGTIGGMIDPFYLNGISAALISGKIAAMFFMDRNNAFQEFKRFTRYFYIKQSLKLISDNLPFKRISFPAIATLNNKFKMVGVI